MEIHKIMHNKKDYIDLLLLADEQEDMIDLYLDRGEMYILEDDGVKAVAVVTDEGDRVAEIKNIAVSRESQGRGYGRCMIEYLCDKYMHTYEYMQVGTGDSPLTIPFYEKCGFERYDVIENFFTDNYDHPIYECGVLLKDMIILRKKLTNK